MIASSYDSTIATTQLGETETRFDSEKMQGPIIIFLEVFRMNSYPCCLCKNIRQLLQRAHTAQSGNRDHGTCIISRVREDTKSKIAVYKRGAANDPFRNSVALVATQMLIKVSI